jgi:general stress protein CsbA
MRKPIRRTIGEYLGDALQFVGIGILIGCSFNKIWLFFIGVLCIIAGYIIALCNAEKVKHEG